MLELCTSTAATEPVQSNSLQTHVYRPTNKLLGGTTHDSHATNAISNADIQVGNLTNVQQRCSAADGMQPCTNLTPWPSVSEIVYRGCCFVALLQILQAVNMAWPYSKQLQLPE